MVGDTSIPGKAELASASGFSAAAGRPGGRVSMQKGRSPMSHKWIRMAILAIVAALMGVTVGALRSNLTGDVQTAMAVCGTNPVCPFGEPTRTSSLTVYHRDVSSRPVVPNTGETWDIIARYRLAAPGTACDCENRYVYATVDVDWTGSAWTATCTSGCGGGSAFTQVAVCDASSPCPQSANPTMAYEMILDMVSNQLFNTACGVAVPGALQEVDYGTTSVDDGNPITDTTTCALGNSESPTTNTFTATDNGTFECAFTCADATGPSVTISYQ